MGANIFRAVANRPGESVQTATEYALVIALVAIVVVGVCTTLGSTIAKVLTSVIGSL